MSTNDDSARRGRRADQGEPDWRAGGRSGNQYPDPRDNQAQQAPYSGYSRQSFNQQPYSPPRQEPPLQQPGRPYDAPQGYYQDPAPQQTYYQGNYVEPASPYAPQPSPYDAGQQNYGTGGELFGRDPSAPPQDYGQNPYGTGTGYRQESFDSYAPRQDNAPRYYAPDDQRSAPPPAIDRGYQPQPQSQPPALYNPQATYEQQPPAQDNYQRGAFDPAFPPAAQGWEDDEPRSGRPPLAAHHDEFDEEFPDEDFDSDDYAPQKGSKKKLFAALLLSAAAVVVGGAYGYKMLTGKGERGTPLIQAMHGPSKEAPENPGGKQFPHGEKAIYDRLSPDGRTQVASFEPAAAAVPAPLTAPAVSNGSGSSLEDRIDEALKKAHGGRNDTPSNDQPTMVHSENYRPDGTRVDSGRPVITPNIVNVDNGLPYPFGNAASQPVGQPAPMLRPAAAAPAQPQFATSTAAPPPAAKPVKTAAHTAPPPAPAPVPEPSTASAVPASAGGFYVSLKSAPDEKAIQKDLTALTEKYKSVLGEVQLTTKIADLGAKGVTYRAVAGPLGTKQEAMDLCTKIKGVGGDKACFVTN
jgi:hypothetical protein